LSTPFHADFSSVPENTRMLSHWRRFILISWQPTHVQGDPVGESRDSIFICCLVGTSRVKTFAVQQTNHRLMRIAAAAPRFGQRTHRAKTTSIATGPVTCRAPLGGLAQVLLPQGRVGLSAKFSHTMGAAKVHSQNEVAVVVGNE
jgi:hypothetical protein